MTSTAPSAPAANAALVSTSAWIARAATTDTDARPHQGISELLIRMDTPGVTVRPIRDMVGEEHFGEVFFDDVRVPASCLIGKLHRGFYQIMEQLDYERSGIERLLSNAPLWRATLERAQAQGRTNDPVLRQRIAQPERIGGAEPDRGRVASAGQRSREHGAGMLHEPARDVEQIGPRSGPPVGFGLSHGEPPSRIHVTNLPPGLPHRNKRTYRG